MYNYSLVDIILYYLHNIYNNIIILYLFTLVRVLYVRMHIIGTACMLSVCSPHAICNFTHNTIILV